MKLNYLFSFLNLQSYKTKSLDFLQENQDEVSSFVIDHRLVQQHSVFCAIKGHVRDGHDFIQEAINLGAFALVVEDISKVPSDFLGFAIEVPDTRVMCDILSARFYDYPSQKLFCFGVTGTNGKTSITYMIEHILASQNKKIGVMGTVNHRIGHKVWSSEMTTPDAITLQSRLKDFLDEGAMGAALEVSSHALDQNRVESVHFNTVIFTNLTHDHLDYHKTMKHYFESKQKLFTQMMWSSLKRPLFAIVNVDDDYGRKLKLADPVIGWTYGQSESDFQFKILKMNFIETEFELTTPIESKVVKVPLTGVHTIYNIVAAMAACLTAGITLEQAVQSLQSFSGVPGRLERVTCYSNKIAFVDYAHTPDALENSLKSLQKVRKDSNLTAKIITVFGCGGDRDKTKRPKMAAIAEKFSDFVFVTSDNPRTENPESILQDIKTGFSSEFTQYQIERDRELAIKLACEKAQAEDVILIAGKGHEDYQIIGTQKNHFSDVEVVKKYL